MQYIIDQIILAAGQWQKFKDKQFEQRFEMLLQQLQAVTGKDQEGALQLVLQDLGVEEVAA